MARPTKQGIDYFPVDVNFDEKIEMYLIEKEAIGLAVLISAWQLIYKNEGYYSKNGNDFFLLIKKQINVPIETIRECINSCIKRGIFNERLHKKFGILTSRAIQKRFFDAAKRKKETKYIGDYLLVDVSVYENLVNVNINEDNVSRNATKEEEEEKEDIKEKIPFDTFWNLYDKKVGKKSKVKSKWNKLSEETQLKALKHITAYKQSQPDKQYRKHPETYLNNESWNDEIIRRKDGTSKSIFESDEFRRKAERIAESIANDNDLE